MRRGGVISGVAMLLTLFCSLCLLLIAVLSYRTADSERKLAELSLRQAEAFYNADTLAQERVAALAAEELPEGTVTSFSLPVGERMALQVELQRENGKDRILRWQTAYEGEWKTEETTRVWEGE